MNNEIITNNKPTSKKISVLAFLRSIQNKISASPYSYLLFAFIIPIIIMYAAYAAFGIHPFGERSPLVLDLNGQYVYFFEALRNFVRGDASLLYSFSRAMGGEFMGIYAYYLSSPLSYLVALFPTNMMIEAVLTLILLKVGLCGASFGWYLHKSSRTPNKFVIIAFSIMYSLCGYAVIYQENTMWMDALILLPIITFSIEQLIKFRKYKLFVISLSLAIICNYYIGYMLCIYVAIYFFYYFFAHSDEVKNPLSERRHFIRSLVRIAIFSLIAIAISALIIFSAYYSLTFGKTEFSNPDWAFEENFEFLDFFTKFLPSSYDSVDYGGLPLVYGGVLMIILLPVYFVCKNISAREKFASLGVISIFILSMLVSPLNLIWHGFQFPNWLDYRYSFMLVFFMLVFAYKGFGNIRTVGSKFLVGVGAIIILFTAFCQKQEFESYVTSDKKLLSLQTVWLTIIATVFFVALLCLFIRLKDKIKKQSVCCILVALVCIEFFCSTLACIFQHHAEVTYAKYDSYNEFLEGLRPVTDKLESRDTSFYRYEKTHHRKYNDNMALDIRGLSNSTSTLNASSINFLKKLGYASDSHWSKYLGENPVNDSILGIKYIINKGTSKILEEYYVPAFEEGDYLVYMNPYALSLAYGVSSDINTLDLTEQTISFDVSNDLVSAMLGEETSIFKPIELESTEPEYCSLKTGYKGGLVKYENTASDKNGTLTFTITAPTDDEIFIHMPSDYKRKSNLTVNGSNKGTIFDKDTRRMISLGKYEKGEKLTVTITINNSYDNIFFTPCDTYFYYLDFEAFEAAFEKLGSSPQLVINEGFTDDYLEGTITTDKDNQTILTTIPYDEGWNIYIDGEKAEYYKSLDTFIALDITTAGNHSVILEYSPGAVSTGLIITTIGIFTFVLICIIDFIVKKKFKKQTDVPSEVLWELEAFNPDLCELEYEENGKNEIFSFLSKGLKKVFTKKSKDLEDKESNNTDKGE